jgi:hypothetical protein
MGFSEVIIPHLQNSNVKKQVMVLVGVLNKTLLGIWNKKKITGINAATCLKPKSFGIAKLDNIIHSLIGLIELVDLGVGLKLIREDTEIFLVVIRLLNVLVFIGVGLLIIGHKASVHLGVLYNLDPVLSQ